MDLEKVKKELSGKKNINGIIPSGYKRKNGVKTGELSIIVMVEKKVPKEQLKKKDFIPSEIEGVRTDVIQVGKLKALGVEKKDRPERYRPAPMGSSGGHYKITAGTNGELLRDRETKILCIGTNKHVGAPDNAKIGDPYLQPGPYDGGKVETDMIGRLFKFVPISFMGIDSDCPVAGAIVKVSNFFAKLLNRRTRLKATVEANPTYNRVDGAMIRVKEEDVLPDIIDIGIPKGVGKAELEMLVQKSGRTTEHTKNGEVIGIDAVVGPISYGDKKTAYFENQIVISGPSFCAGGDSGSLVLDMNGKAVGKLFAGSEITTIANSIDDYLNELDAELVIR